MRKTRTDVAEQGGMERTYRVNDIFYSLQGEGYHAGRAAAFVRFAGCNLRCAFCDTDFADYRPMTAREIVAAIAAYPARFVVLTGGEPTLQVDAELTARLHEAGFYVAMESNGTRRPPTGIDWLTVSPKSPVAVTRCQELKCIFERVEAVDDHGVEADHRYLQPCDVGDAGRNAAITQACVAYVEAHPEWKLSLQLHKLAGFK